MEAMLLESHVDIKTHPTPLSLVALPEPTLAPGEILLRVSRCGVCHTELDEIEGRIKPRLPIVLGHQVIGIVEGVQSLLTLELSHIQHQEMLDSTIRIGQRVGVAWIASAC